MIRGIHQVVLEVDDQDRALAFWTEALGFELAEDAPYGDERWLEVHTPDGAVTFVLSLREGERPTAPEGLPTSNIMFYCDDLARTSRRRVPLTRRALDALERIPARLDSPLLFPAPKGGYIGLDTWRTREWYPALEAAAITKRGPYHLRHTFATEALAAGVSIFELARLMGTSVAMIDRTYGHLARDSESAIRARLDARAGRSGVDLASESQRL